MRPHAVSPGDSSDTTDSPNQVCTSSAYESAVEDQDGIATADTSLEEGGTLHKSLERATSDGEMMSNDAVTGVAGARPWRSCRGVPPAATTNGAHSRVNGVGSGGSKRRSVSLTGEETSESSSAVGRPSIARVKDMVMKRELQN